MPRPIVPLMVLVLAAPGADCGPHLPLSATFKGHEKFAALEALARHRNWRNLPIGDRLAAVALEFVGTPYESYTLEIHDHIESPSANLLGLDCWTFFEVCLGFARMLESPRDQYAPDDLLRQIEHTRYRGGTCHGNYLDRIHYLAEWFQDNQRRGTIHDLTRSFPHRRMPPQCGEMTRLWRHYRYLKYNPDLRKGMARHEQRLNQIHVHMVPKGAVATIEPRLRNGDIIGIARHDHGSFCSHVGIIITDRDGARRFMHASSTRRKVVIDTTISSYLQRHRKHAGILVARPK